MVFRIPRLCNCQWKSLSYFCFTTFHEHRTAIKNMPSRQFPGLKGHQMNRRHMCIICGLSSSSPANSVRGKKKAEPQRFTESLQKIFKESIPGGETYDKDDLSLPDGCCSSCRAKIFKIGRDAATDGQSTLPELFHWPPYEIQDDLEGFCECFLCKRARNRHHLTQAAKSDKKNPARKRTAKPKQTYYGF